MVIMTNSVYTSSTIKNEQHEDPDYMDINPDEVEAGSILMSLSQHKQHTQQTTITNTMSISNLLGNNDDEKVETSNRTQLKMDVRTIITPTEGTMYEKKEMACSRCTKLYFPLKICIGTLKQPNKVNSPFILISKKVPPAYPEKSQSGIEDMHAASYSLPIASTRIKSDSLARNFSGQTSLESSTWQQRSPAHTHYTQQQEQRHHQQHHLQCQQQYQSHQHQHQYHQQQYHHQQQQHHQYNQPPSYSQQSFQSMKNNPKIRRNMLHAFISYMTYSDMARQKSNRSISYPHANPPIKQHTEHTMQQHPPLTAFLKHNVDPHVIPSTPRPQQPPLNHSHPSYHSPPPPSQYRYPYPHLS
ncbi:uncharacterized protein BX664DRAFT_319232 [Halteromyces radiatus]|uniref:uncharacterized protein n=1 Tax=Halteromyces radiatus TaxID=101107 RepID=UPI00221E3D01|nr:uncharacterized protein BX664DRAFT_319232 [Halteromyces radiatus]KAI8098636.1 hypothetical protein BX664DRAFT_319232 [Halteromyces radiatus]